MCHGITDLSAQWNVVTCLIRPPQFALTFTALDRILSDLSAVQKVDSEAGGMADLGCTGSGGGGGQ